MSQAQTLAGAVSAAVAPALILAVIFGARDALRAVHRNTYVHLSRYFWLYVAAPIVALTLLACGVAVTVGVIGLLAGVPLQWIAGGSAGLLVASYLGVDAHNWLVGVRDAMRNARVQRSAQRRAAVLLRAVLAATLVAVTVGVAVWFAHVDMGVTRAGAMVAVGVNVALLPALVMFVIRDFRLFSPPSPASGEGRGEGLHVVERGDGVPGRGTMPSIVLISIDTLRADRLGCYGGQRGLTPNLDELAAAGVVCETAIAQSSWTLPSIASFLTGLNPSRHGAGWPLNGFDLMARAPLRRGTWTLAEGLKAAGYRTHAIVSNPYLAVQYGLDAGFDTYENVSIESEALVALRPTVAGQLLAPLLGQHIGDSGRIVTQRTLRLLGRLGNEPAERHAPFFLWLHYIDPHAPYGCAGTKSFRGDTLLSGITHDEARIGSSFEAIARLRAGEIRLSPTEKEQLIALYDVGVQEVDRQVGVVVNRVRELCRAANRASSPGAPDASRLPPPAAPLIAVVVDHGEELWDHGGVEHGHTFYDELVRVPLIFAGGGLPEGERITQLVRLIDLPPTVLDLAGVPVPDALEGATFREPLASRSNGAHAGERRLTSTIHEPCVALCESLLFAEDKVALRTERHKYVRWANGKEELYGLCSDPAELRDLAATADLTWARRLVTAQDTARLERGAAEGPDGFDADSAAIHARLEGLGYV